MISAFAPLQMSSACQLVRKGTVMLTELLHYATLLEVESWETTYRDPV